MNQRRPWSGPPNLVFTSDFHQLVRGRLARGLECTISYDPRRIVPPGEPYTFGSDQVKIAAHVKFKSADDAQVIPLVSWAGMVEHITTTASGIGPMLRGVTRIPEDAEWVTVWFTCTAADGGIRYDSNYGANYIFRFKREDLELVTSEVRVRPRAATDFFHCVVAADSAVERVTARYRIVNSPAQSAEIEVELARTEHTDEDGRVLWETRDVPVPHGAVIAFDVVYYVEGKRFKDDNRGFYFIAAEPKTMAAASLPQTK